MFSATQATIFCSGVDMGEVNIFTPDVVAITPDAVAKVKNLQAEENNPNLKLRVYVTGGGCSGFQYGFSFEDTSDDDDTLICSEGITVLVDSLSYQYLEGSTLDYEQSLMGSRFLIKNPNAQTTCGCGLSFSI